MRVAVVGAGGKMGIETCRALAADPSVELVAAVHPRHAGRALSELCGIGGTLVVAGTLEAGLEAGAEVIVEFTTAAAAVTTLEFAAAHGLHAVSGTTGIAADDLERLARAFAPPRAPNAVVAANFSISAVVLARLAELAAPYFSMAEIVELHHEHKVDAPSGTAIETARLLAAARAAAGAGEFTAAVPATEVLPGARGALGPGGVRLHSVRLSGLVAHEEVLLGAPGQSLTLRQDTYDRGAYMPGMLLALHRVAELPGLTVGLGALLGLGS